MALTAAEISELETRRARYILAETAVLGGQAYSLQGRSLTRVDLRWIREGITELTAQLNAANAGNIFKTHRVVPRDI